MFKGGYLRIPGMKGCRILFRERLLYYRQVVVVGVPDWKLGRIFRY